MEKGFFGWLLARSKTNWNPRGVCHVTVKGIQMQSERTHSGPNHATGKISHPRKRPHRVRKGTHSVHEQGKSFKPL
jgi:hypothetical protein